MAPSPPWPPSSLAPRLFFFSPLWLFASLASLDARLLGPLPLWLLTSFATHPLGYSPLRLLASLAPRLFGYSSLRLLAPLASWPWLRLGHLPLWLSLLLDSLNIFEPRQLYYSSLASRLFGPFSIFCFFGLLHLRQIGHSPYLSLFPSPPPSPLAPQPSSLLPFTSDINKRPAFPAHQSRLLASVSPSHSPSPSPSPPPSPVSKTDSHEMLLSESSLGGTTQHCWQFLHRPTVLCSSVHGQEQIII